MSPLSIDYLPHLPVGQLELVERKGLGHPDSMCDAIMEAISVALCRTYVDPRERLPKS
jgi:S-adenosylmethionine synthetase